MTTETGKGNNKIKVGIQGKVGLVNRFEYVKAKTKQLQEFGYPTLTEDEVDLQVDAILKHRRLNVIGMFMQDEVKP